MSSTGSSQLFCIVCNSNVDSTSCTNIFLVSLPRNGEILANFIFEVLSLSPLKLPSSFICSRCFNLFGMLDEAQWSVQNVKGEILKVYQPHNQETSIAHNEVINLPLSNENEEYGILEEQKVLESKSILDNYENLLPNFTNVISSNLVSPTNAQHFEDSKLPVIDNFEQTEPGDFTDVKPNSQNNGIDLDYGSYGSQIIETDNLKCNTSTNIVKCVDISIRKVQNQLELVILDKEVDTKENKPTDRNTDATSQANIPPVSKTPNIKKIPKTKENSPNYECPICHKKWGNKGQFNAHMKTHSNVRPYMCEKCGQSYKRKNALEIHVGMHNGVSPYQCDHCNKCFTQKGALQRHLPIHTGEMPYQCEICGKRFVHHTSYNMHILSHTKQKAYKCSVCELSLLSTSHLKRHMRVHTGEKPFSCDVCNKSFAERYNLIAHHKLHGDRLL